MSIEDEKQDILNKVIPKVALKAMTKEAIDTLEDLNPKNNFISIVKLPYRIGRDARTKVVFSDHHNVIEKRSSDLNKSTGICKNNELYLIDREKYLQISREHLSIIENGIEEKNISYFLIDRGSRMGTMIGDKLIGGNGKGGKHPLVDGDIIGIGKSTTPYFFKFLIF